MGRRPKQLTIKVQNDDTKAPRRTNQQQPTTKRKGGRKKKPQPKTQNNNDRKRGRNINNPVGMALGRSLASGPGLSPAAKRVVLAATLPYNFPPVRVRAESNSMEAVPSAVSKMYEFIDISTASITAVIDTNKFPKPGTFTNGQPVWADITKSISIVSVLDTRLLAIVPQRVDIVAVGRDYDIIYQASAFMNQGQASPGDFILHADVPNFIEPPTPLDVRYINANQTLWFEPVDFFPAFDSTGDGSRSYGPLHPVLDFNQDRYFWIDAHNTEGNVESNSTNGSVVQLIFTLPAGLEIVKDPQSSVLEGGSVKFVARRLNICMESDDSTLYTHFAQTATPGEKFASLLIQESGYYKLGMEGFFKDVTPNNYNKILAGVKLRYLLSRNINIVSRHIINTSLVPTTEIYKKMFSTEQTVGGAMLIQNTTPVITKGGKIYALSITTDTPWYGYTRNGLKTRSLNNDDRIKYDGMLDTGCYGWLRNANTGFRTCNDTINHESGFTSCIRSYSIGRKTPIIGSKVRGFNVYTVVPPTSNVPAIGEISALDTQLTLMMAVNFEFTTDNQLPLVSSNAVSVYDYQMACGVLSNAKTFTENPLHLSDFTNLVSGAFNRARQFATENRDGIRKMLAALSSFGHPVVSAIGNGGLLLDTLVG